MAITLAIADNADDTGATATITGSPVGSANVVYTVTDGVLSGSLGTATNSGNRTGDGTVSLALSTGYYVGYVVSTDAGSDSISNLVRFIVTTGNDSIQQQILDGIVAAIKTLTLTGISTTDIVGRKLPFDVTKLAPGVFVTPVAESLEQNGNIADDYTFRYQVTTVQASNRDLTSNLDRHLNWRDQIQSKLLPRGSAPVLLSLGVTDVRIQPGPPIDVAAFIKQYDVGTLIISCVYEKQRTA